MDKATFYLLVPLLPLMGALLVGLSGRLLSFVAAHTIAIAGVAGSFLLSAKVLVDLWNGQPTFNGNLYSWITIDGIDLNVGFLVDKLTAMMMVVVTFVSLMVHVYTIGYMKGDPGYKRFFSYISLFTFSMLMLVMSNNFLQLFFGWEAVGVVSYLLIGFWFKRPTAIFANLKAFLINRVGDFGFLLGIGLVLMHFGSLDYATIFGQVHTSEMQQFWMSKTINLLGSTPVGLITAICLLLFVGAMGKSAQVPLHVWLPDSMEGPTPISALIHAATMVTAGIFMVARMSPLFELSPVALSTILIIGATTALFMGFLGIIQNDIKRVVAYSTLSQLGYMTVALGVSAYQIGVFHLMTHAFFKALLFLAAGSVIMGMHHDQDIRNMGGLRKYMPVTWITSLIGSLALIGTPLFSGFYSKDAIIEAVAASKIVGSSYAYFAVIAGVFITAFYSFRMYFLVFHGENRWRSHGQDHGLADSEEHHGLSPGDDPHESSWVVLLPLIALAIPSLSIGFIAAPSIMDGRMFGSAIYSDMHDTMRVVSEEFHGSLAMAVHAFSSAPFWLALSGVVAAWVLYVWKPSFGVNISSFFRSLGIVRLLENRYYMDHLYIHVMTPIATSIGRVFWKVGDVLLIDGLVVNGAAKLVDKMSKITSLFHRGYIYASAFSMILGAVVLLLFWSAGTKQILAAIGLSH
ncbi:NADH-quinone oxidoreductase subunit L [Parachitinimonas caeni]|uniref:NADH-quinone oxidoreductase subunit L n=1 Tax=Parachitinimonas caeni TaxID=3031301 RepID=A0ABT7E052_9NEIS|nr:NADH-quinone oxidoreductase subunit L [Parachitinimonas caeni]MDK2124810.1 NADH-quinone oxidoreductase subunit L [Parachitinimonas caeni]